MTWKSELRALIERSWRPGERFTLEEVYRFEPHFCRLYPDNHHSRAKLRQVLQQLSKDGVLEFLDNYGLYTRPSPDDKEDANVGVCVFPDEVLEPTKYSEGAGHTVAVNAYERDPQARRDCIRHYGADCCICGFNFGATYGEDGEGYIHVHHLVPLSEIGEEYIVDPIKDLRPVCPNCHAALHLGGTCRTIEELQALVERHGGT